MDDETVHTKAAETVVPVIEEELVTGKRAVAGGSVRVRKEVERKRKAVEMRLLRDVTDVTRVAINRVVETMPQMREQDGTIIIPVVEEELVIQKRLVLKEEIHIRRSQVTEQVSKIVTVGREHAIVERVDTKGHVIASSDPARSKG